MTKRWTGLVAAGTALLAAALFLGGAASADPSGTIDHVQSRNGTVQVLYSIPGLDGSRQPDFSSVTATLDGTPVDATAVYASRPGSQGVTRTAILVIDASTSMTGPRLAGAKAAAMAFISRTPADVRIGLVTFAGNVFTTQAPTRSRPTIRAAVQSVRVFPYTRLYDGVQSALRVAGTHGLRRLVLLTDGHNTTGAPPTAAIRAVRASGDRLDIVGLQVSPADAAILTRLATAGHGTLVKASNRSAVSALFADEAQALARQVLVTFPVPPGLANTDANLVVSLAAGGTTYSDSVAVSLGSARGHSPVSPPPSSLPVVPAAAGATTAFLVGGVLVIAIALLLAMVALFRLFTRRPMSMDEKLADYTMSKVSATAPRAESSLRATAVQVATKALGNKGLESKLSQKLTAAGMSVKPGEWALMHAGVIVLAPFVGFLVSGGSILITVLMLGAAAGLPGSISASRRPDGSRPSTDSSPTPFS